MKRSNNTLLILVECVVSTVLQRFHVLLIRGRSSWRRFPPYVEPKTQYMYPYVGFSSRVPQKIVGLGISPGSHILLTERQTVRVTRAGGSNTVDRDPISSP